MFDGLLFDLDGTLWDSVDAICVSWNQVLARRLPEYAGAVTRQKLLPCMGMLLPDIMARLLPREGREKIAPLLDELMEHENRYVAVHGGTLYPRVPETLELLSLRYPLFIVSNCQAGYIEAFFHAHGLGKYFADYENPGRTGLDKAGNIALVARRNGLKRPLYIGDAQLDCDSAAQAGVPFLYAAYGFGRVEAPVPAVQNFADIPAAVAALEGPP